MDSANTLILLCGLLLVVSILAAVVSNRLGAPVLLTFLLVGMLAGEQGILGVEFNNPDIAFLLARRHWLLFFLMVVCELTQNVSGWRSGRQ